MRWLLAGLVVANLFAYALFQGWLSPWIRGDREPQRLVEQRNPDRLRVVPLERLGAPQPTRSPTAPNGASSRPVPAPPSVSPLPSNAAPGPASSLAPPIPSAPTPAEATPPATASRAAGACVAFAALDEQRATRLAEALESAGARVESTRVEQAASYLVYVPAPATPADAQRRLAALRRAGQADVYVMQDGPQRLGIAVGLFRSEEMARALVTRLESAGETGLRIAPRGAVASRVRLQARWPDAAGASGVATIASRFDATPRDCD
jgi:hypothetical protein